jgi:hypothetical protein
MLRNATQKGQAKRDQARLCRELAGLVKHREARRQLDDLIRELEQRADELDSPVGAPAGRRRHRPGMFADLA